METKSEHLAKVLIFDGMKTEKINKESGLKLHSQTKSTKMSTNCMTTPHMKTTKTSKTKNSTTEQQEHPHTSQPATPHP